MAFNVNRRAQSRHVLHTTILQQTDEVVTRDLNICLISSVTATIYSSFPNENPSLNDVRFRMKWRVYLESVVPVSKCNGVEMLVQ